MEGHGRSGCGGGGDPGLRETGTGMWSCLSALFEEILCTVSQKMKGLSKKWMAPFVIVYPTSALHDICRTAGTLKSFSRSG